VFLIALILIFIVHTVIVTVHIVSVHTVLYIFCTRAPVSASEPRCSIISVHYCLTFISTLRTLIINSI